MDPRHQAGSDQAGIARFDRAWMWVGLFVLSVGGLILAGGVYLASASFDLYRHGARAEGEVIELRPDGDMYAPVVRFILPDGRPHEVADLATGSPDFAIGDRVTVLYAPADPDSFRIATFGRLWLNALFVGVFGSFWLLFGFTALAVWREVNLFIVGESLFAAIALGAAVIGVFVARDAAQLYTSGARAEGTVLSFHQSRSTEQEERVPGRSETRRDVEVTTYAPVVRFVTAEGRTIEFNGRGGSDTNYAEGDRVTVIYDPANPIHASIAGFVELWLPSAVCWGVFAIFGGVVLLSRTVRHAGARAAAR